MGSQRVGHVWVTITFTFTFFCFSVDGAIAIVFSFSYLSCLYFSPEISLRIGVIDLLPLLPEVLWVPLSSPLVPPGSRVLCCYSWCCYWGHHVGRLLCCVQGCLSHGLHGVERGSYGGAEVVRFIGITALGEADLQAVQWLEGWGPRPCHLCCLVPSLRCCCGREAAVSCAASAPAPEVFGVWTRLSWLGSAIGHCLCCTLSSGFSMWPVHSFSDV